MRAVGPVGKWSSRGQEIDSMRKGPIVADYFLYIRVCVVSSLVFWLEMIMHLMILLVFPSPSRVFLTSRLESRNREQASRHPYDASAVIVSPLAALEKQKRALVNDGIAACLYPARTAASSAGFL